MREFILSLCVMVLGCGASSTAGSGRSTAGTSARTTSARIALSVLFSPLEAHLTSSELAPIGDFLERWAQTPYAQLPENDTVSSTTFLFLAWVTESPDVHITICPLPTLMEEGGHGGDPGPSLTIGSLAGMTHYLIRHPHANPDSAEVQVAGAEWGLRWYSASVANGETPNTAIDTLLARARREGGLAGWYEERGIRCGNQR